MKIKIKDIKIGNRHRSMSQFEYDQLKSSIGDYGVVQPIVADKDLNLLDGFARVDAAKDLGLEEVEAIIMGTLILTNGSETVTLLDYKEESDGWYGHEFGSNGLVDRQVGFYPKDKWRF